MKLRTRLALLAALSLLVGALAQGQQNATPADLLVQFDRTTVFWRQFEVAKQIAKIGDARVLTDLEPWLVREDRHLRGNTAFVFASLDDPRGFETIRVMLTDRSYRPEGQGIPGGSAIQALERLEATEALPHLRALLHDQAMPSAGPRVSVAETAKAAIMKLQREP